MINGQRCTGSPMRKNATRVGLVLLLTLGGVIMLWQWVLGGPRPNPIRLTMHLWAGYAHAYIAQEKGFFKEEGVDVELSLIEGVDDNLNHFRQGKADAAFGLILLDLE